MTSSIVVTVKSGRSSGDLARFVEDTSNPRGEARKLSHLFSRLASGLEPGSSFDVQTATSAPAAASVTMTGVSVVATNAVSIGGVVFTYTASPTLSTDVMVTVPTAVVVASGANLSAVTGKVTSTAHGLVTGDLVRVSTGTTLPTLWVAATDYFVIKISADVFKIATSLANATAGVALIPSDGGTGNQTFTVTPNTYKAQKLAAAINAHATLGLAVVATYAANVVTITALQKGVLGNYVATSQTSGSTITVSATTLTGGTGGATSAVVSYSRGL